MLKKTRTHKHGSKTSKNIVFRMTDEEVIILLKKAKLFSNGNSSEFIRHAILSWNPNKAEQSDMAQVVNAPVQ